MTEFEKGDKVYVKYGGGDYAVRRAYKAKLLAQDNEGYWIVRECWTTSKRVVSESSLVHVA